MKWSVAILLVAAMAGCVAPGQNGSEATNGEGFAAASALASPQPGSDGMETLDILSARHTSEDTGRSIPATGLGMTRCTGPDLLSFRVDETTVRTQVPEAIEFFHPVIMDWPGTVGGSFQQFTCDMSWQGHTLGRSSVAISTVAIVPPMGDTPTMVGWYLLDLVASDAQVAQRFGELGFPARVADLVDNSIVTATSVVVSAGGGGTTVAGIVPAPLGAVNSIDMWSLQGDVLHRAFWAPNTYMMPVGDITQPWGWLGEATAVLDPAIWGVSAAVNDLGSHYYTGVDFRAPTISAWPFYET